jgi:hypothetical protein
MAALPIWASRIGLVLNGKGYDRALHGVDEVNVAMPSPTASG